MVRVRFPLIVRKTVNGAIHSSYAKEDFAEQGFGWTNDQLDATVYASSKEFRAYWGQSATQLFNTAMKHYDILNEEHWLWELVYVGE